MDISPRRRHAISTVLAIFLAVESVSAVAAAGVSVTSRGAASAPADVAPTPSPIGLVFATAGAAAAAPAPTPTASPAPTPSPVPTASPAPAAVATPSPASAATPKPTVRPTPKPAPTPRPAVKAAPKPKPRPRPASTTAHVGRNHVWIPSLGIDKSISWFSCTRSTPPDNYVYRWGCAGTNNVYLLGHAASVFRPLHDAYLDGRLKVGMRVWYADNSGNVHQYSVIWWKLTKPTTDAAWAWAAQSVPSMTLQTCMGATSQYRLMVRLVQVG